MAIRTIVSTIDGLNGQVINTIQGLTAAETIIGTVLRKNMCVGASFINQATFSLTIPDGTVATFTIPNTGGAGLPPVGTTLLPTFSETGGPTAEITMVVQQGAGVEEENWYAGVDFTVGGAGNRTLTFTNDFVGTNKVATITFSYYDPIVANLSFDTKVMANNCKAVATLDGLPIILWMNGIQAQEIKAGVTAGTVNAVVRALITDA